MKKKQGLYENKQTQKYKHKDKYLIRAKLSNKKKKFWQKKEVGPMFGNGGMVTLQNCSLYP